MMKHKRPSGRIFTRKEVIMKKYTEEKVLYFANQKTGLHVQSSERARNTTLWGLVCRLVASNKIHCIAEDDSGKYYMTTKLGDIALLEMQIDWRKTHGTLSLIHISEPTRRRRSSYA